MLQLELKHIRLSLDFSFFAVLALYLFFDESGFGSMALGSCLVHELAHFAAMALFSVPIERVALYGGGIRIISSSVIRSKVYQRVIILSIGCAVNFLVSVLFLLAGNYPLFAINLFTGTFNLLPIGELDGAGLLKILIIRCCKAEYVDTIMKSAAAASVIICAGAAFAAGVTVSFTLITTALYMITVNCREL